MKSTRPDDMRCRDCRWFDPFEPMAGSPRVDPGQCRVRSHHELWPVREGNEWCGEFALGLSEEAWHFKYNMHHQW